MSNELFILTYSTFYVIIKSNNEVCYMKHLRLKSYLRFLASLLCISIVISSMSSICFSDSYQPEEYFEDIEFITTLNDKEDFPLSVNFEHNQDSVHYSSSKKNDYGTPLLICDELQFNLSFSCKSNDFIEELSITNHDSNIFCSESLNSFVLTSDQININERYEYEFKYDNYHYIGYFTLRPNGDYKIYFDTIYNFVEVNNSNFQRNTTSMRETESNNSFSTADTAYANRTIAGNLSSSSDIDYYKYTIDVELSSGYLDVMLYCPTYANYNFTVYGGQNHVVLGST